MVNSVVAYITLADFKNIMSQTSRQRVVITGLGVVSPIGVELDQLWESLTQQRSAVRPLQSLPTEGFVFRSGGECTQFNGDIGNYGTLDKQLPRAIKKNMKVMCREIEMGVAAAQKALASSGLTTDQRDPDRCGCLFGCDYILTRPEEFADGVRSCRATADKFEVPQWPQHGLAKVNPLWLLKYLPNMPNSHVAIYNDLRGPNNSLTVREASMNLSLSESTAIIQRGVADAMLVGATGSRVHPLRAAHVSMTERVAPERSNPAEMACPFDSAHSGMVLGEGAGALMLESLEHAQARGAEIWGEIIGHGSVMVGRRGDRDFIRQAVSSSLRIALESAGDQLPSNWHVHAQGLSIPETDRSEAAGIADVLANRKGEHRVTCAKSYFGNLGAGAAAVEIISSLLALRHNRLFPILNLKNPIPEATWLPAQAGDLAGDGFVHLSFTPQGQASAIFVRKYV